MHYHYDIAFLTGKWPALDFQERKCEQVRSLLLLCSRPTPWILHFFLECSLPRMHSYHNFHHSAFLNITVHIAALPICKTCNIFLFVVHKVQVLLIFSLKQKKTERSTRYDCSGYTPLQCWSNTLKSHLLSKLWDKYNVKGFCSIEVGRVEGVEVRASFVPSFLVHYYHS